MAYDLHSRIKCSQAFPPKAAVTDNTAQVSNILDTANFDANELVLTTGTLSDADATFTLLMEEGDNSALSDNAAIADTALLGVESAGNGSFTFAEDNKTIKIGYKGTKRYIRATVTPANNTGNLFLAGVWIQSQGNAIPYTTQQV
jgi:hypothetical protein